MKVKMILENNDEIVIELYKDIAPITVDNFIELVKDRFYDGMIFHRVIKGFMSQGGGYFIKNNSLHEKKSKAIKGEFLANGVPNLLKHEVGVISMARTSDPNSASSQFFLCAEGCSHLDNQYAAFGKVTDNDSLNNLRKLNNLKTTAIGYLADFPNSDPKNFTIKTIEIIEE